MKLSVLGAGSFATSIGQILADNGHEVLFWSIEEEVNLDINENKKNSKYGFENKINDNIAATNNLETFLNYSDHIFNVLPTQYIRITFNKINKILNKPKHFINCSKGIEPDTLLFIHDIIKDTIESKYYLDFVDITGPSHAELLAQRSLTALTVASENLEFANKIADLIKNDYIKTQISTDVFGLEFVSSAKNVIALGAGMLSGLGHGENIIAAFISQGFSEIITIGKTLNIKLDTMLSFGGLGDLIVTATSNNSRNVKFGTYLGQGYSLEQAQLATKQVAEGVRSLESIYQMVVKNNLNTPIITTMNDIIYNNLAVEKLVTIFD